METEIEQHQGFLVLRLKGNMRLWGRHEMEEKLLEEFRAAVGDATSQVILSLKGLTSVDTLGIAALVRVLIECTKRKMDIKVVMPGGMPGEALRCVRIFEPWPGFNDDSAAIQAAKPITDSAADSPPTIDD